MMKRARIVMMGLLLPLGQAWSSEAATTSGWQVTPFFGYSSAIDFEKSDEVQPVSRSASLDSLQGQSSGSWGFFISKEVDDPGMIELLYSHQSTTLSPDQPDRLTVDTLHFAGALTQLASLRAPVDAFFDGVMVMADDEALKANRLALLNNLRNLFLQVADISLLQ